MVQHKSEFILRTDTITMKLKSDIITTMFPVAMSVVNLALRLKGPSRSSRTGGEERQAIDIADLI